MKKLLLTMFLIVTGISVTNAQTRVEVRESQARIIEPIQNVYIKPLTAKLDLIKGKGKDGKDKICDSWYYTMKDVAALDGKTDNLRKDALFKSTLKHDADVIVAATFELKPSDPTEHGGEKGYEVIVYGYPAIYTEWKTATPEDDQWIHTERTYMSNEAEKNKTQAITQ